jgi:OFA family oxalate/formate antiporter-like MFS transporter
LTVDAGLSEDEGHDQASLSQRRVQATLFGWISDYIGREYTMAGAFAVGGVSYWLLGSMGTTSWAFVIFAGLIFLTWGQIFSIFPSTCTDSFGPRHATANLSLLYTAKGAGAFLVPLANVIQSATGRWDMVFVLSGVTNYLVVGLALFVLRPLRSRHVLTPGPKFASVRKRS